MRGYCTLGNACFGRQRANQGGLRAYSDELTLCPECRERLIMDIRALPRDYVDLTLRARVTRHARDIKRSATVLSYIPLNENIEAACREIHWALTCWVVVVRELCALIPVDYEHMRPGRAVQQSARVIAQRIDLLASAPPTWGYFDGPEGEPVLRDGIDAVKQLYGCHRRSLRLLDLVDKVTHIPGWCTECGYAALRRREESTWIHCANCGHRMMWTDYPQIMLDQVLTTDEADVQRS